MCASAVCWQKTGVLHAPSGAVSTAGREQGQKRRVHAGRQPGSVFARARDEARHPGGSWGIEACSAGIRARVPFLPSGVCGLTANPEGLDVFDWAIKESRLFLDAKELFKVFIPICFAQT